MSQMNATERTALLDGLRLNDEIGAVIDDRTIEILEHRRRTAVVRRRGWLVRRMLLLADLAGLTLAYVVARLVFDDPGSTGDHVRPIAETLLFLATLPVWIVVAKIYGLYDHDEERTDHSTADDLVGVFHLITVGTWLIFAGGMLSGLARPELVRLIFFWGLAIALVTMFRAGARTFCRRRIAYMQNAVIVGAGDVGQLVARKLLQHPEYGINLVGFLDDDPKERRSDVEHLAMLGPPERLPGVVRAFDVERVMIAFSHDSHEDTLSLIRSVKDLNVQVDIVPRLFEIVGPGMCIHTVEGVPLMGLPPLRLSHSSRLLKRAVDLVVGAIALVAIAPLLAFIALRIKTDSPGPVFFRQTRVGIGDTTFRIYKFRTMTADADERKHELAHLNIHAQPGGDPRMFKVPDDPRTTKFGRFLRRYSLDELPQLINVMKGEMSLVGPRPLIADEDRHVAEWARKRVRLKPGITGLWQVLGRSDIPFEEMTKFDYIYVTNWSLGGDLSIILKTIPAVFRSRRAY
jgi:exopolysaccharide biosynthesis polyprenyl glycosylphosphotransferase